MKNYIKAQNKEHLKQLIGAEIEENGNNCSLNHIDVNHIEDMSGLFKGSDFDGDISEWDTSGVIKMSNMFLFSEFNGDISKWSTSRVLHMHSMFCGSVFTGDISNWDVSSVQDMGSMFQKSKFNGDLSRWDVREVKNMLSIFSFSCFKGCLDRWAPLSLSPYSDKYLDSLFYDTDRPIPYWAAIVDKEARDKAIKIYQEKEMLEKLLEEEKGTCLRGAAKNKKI